MHIMFRIFSKYANDKFVDEEDKPFSALVVNRYASNILNTALEIIFSRKSQFVGSKLLAYSLKFLQSSTKIKQTMLVVKPFIESILYEHIVPIMMVGETDLALFYDDGIEYIRKQQDFSDSFYSPRNVAIDLLKVICSYKSEPKQKTPEYLGGFLKFCSDNLQTYKESSATDQNAWRIKDAILLAIGHLEEEINDVKAYKNNMEHMLFTHVFEELKSNQAFLRQRSCWIYGQFGDYKFKDEGHIIKVINSIHENINDTILPVKLSAALSFEKFLTHKKAMEIVKPHLGTILKQYLELMNEIDNEELVSALEYLIDKFEDDIGPFAVELCTQLSAAYQRLATQSGEDESGESVMAAVGCVQAITRIISSIKNNVDLLLRCEDIIYPMMLYSLTPDGMDSIEESIECIMHLAYYTPKGQLSDNMWKLFPQLIYVIVGEDHDPDGGYGFEFLSQITVAVQNFIANDPVKFIQNNGIQKVLIMNQRILKMNRNSEHKLDGIAVLKTLISMFENMPNMID